MASPAPEQLLQKAGLRRPLFGRSRRGAACAGDRQGNAGQKPDLTPGCRLLLVEEVLQSRELLLLRLVLDGTDARQCAPGRQKVVLDRLDLSDAGHAGGAVALSPPTGARQPA